VKDLTKSRETNNFVRLLSDSAKMKKQDPADKQGVMAQVSPQLKANLCRSTLGQLRIPDVPRRWFFESGYTLRVEGWVLSRRISALVTVPVLPWDEIGRHGVV
jgi:hypothetical protein